MMGRTFAQAPVRVYWELTRACDLACRHCRADAMPDRAPDELTTSECEGVLRDLAGAGPDRPHVIFTGGDPLKRPDLPELVRRGVELGLGVSVAPSATVGLSDEIVDGLKAAGVSAMSLSLDGPSAAQHEGLRGVLGCFGWTLAAAERIVAAGIPLQINTLVAGATNRHLDETAKLVARLGASRWSLFFHVPVGRARALHGISAGECEILLGWLAFHAREWPFLTTTTEAPHYRRVLIERMRQAGFTGREIAESAAARSFGIHDGNGIMFIAANGDVMPSGFLPLVTGNVRDASASRIYRESRLFRALRSVGGLRGRCGACPFRSVCGGSRARAYAATGDAMGEDPLCAYQPPRDRRPAAGMSAPLDESMSAG
jgi:radical SAM protein